MLIPHFGHFLLNPNHCFKKTMRKQPATMVPVPKLCSIILVKPRSCQFVFQSKELDLKVKNVKKHHEMGNQHCLMNLTKQILKKNNERKPIQIQIPPKHHLFFMPACWCWMIWDKNHPGVGKPDIFFNNELIMTFTLFREKNEKSHFFFYSIIRICQYPFFRNWNPRYSLVFYHIIWPPSHLPFLYQSEQQHWQLNFYTKLVLKLPTLLLLLRN